LSERWLWDSIRAGEAQDLYLDQYSLQATDVSFYESRGAVHQMCVCITPDNVEETSRDMCVGNLVRVCSRQSALDHTRCITFSILLGISRANDASISLARIHTHLTSTRTYPHMQIHLQMQGVSLQMEQRVAERKPNMQTSMQDPDLNVTGVSIHTGDGGASPRKVRRRGGAFDRLREPTVELVQGAIKARAAGSAMGETIACQSQAAMDVEELTQETRANTDMEADLEMVERNSETNTVKHNEMIIETQKSKSTELGTKRNTSTNNRMHADEETPNESPCKGVHGSGNKWQKAELEAGALDMLCEWDKKRKPKCSALKGSRMQLERYLMLIGHIKDSQICTMYKHNIRTPSRCVCVSSPSVIFTPPETA